MRTLTVQCFENLARRSERTRSAGFVLSHWRLPPEDVRPCLARTSLMIPADLSAGTLVRGREVLRTVPRLIMATRNLFRSIDMTDHRVGLAGARHLREAADAYGSTAGSLATNCGRAERGVDLPPSAVIVCSNLRNQLDPPRSNVLALGWRGVKVADVVILGSGAGDANVWEPASRRPRTRANSPRRLWHKNAPRWLTGRTNTSKSKTPMQNVRGRPRVGTEVRDLDRRSVPADPVRRSRRRRPGRRIR